MVDKKVCDIVRSGCCGVVCLSFQPSMLYAVFGAKLRIKMLSTKLYRNKQVFIRGKFRFLSVFLSRRYRIFNILCDMCVIMNDVNAKNADFNRFLSRNFWRCVAFFRIFVPNI